MRPLDIATDSWLELQQCSTLAALKLGVRRDGKSSVATSGCRSACWKAFLIFESADTSTWLKTLSSSRSAYNSLRSHFLRHIENPAELAANSDPLSEGTDTSPASPWTQLRKDEELRVEIKQDVERCMQENPYFKLAETQRIMLDVLFVYCRLNPDVSYRQGMHEILAPILWVVQTDAIDLGVSSKTMGEDALVKGVFDAAHIEHDAFALFAQVMQSAKNFYEQTTHQGAENPIVSRSRRIFNEMLPLVDAQLAQHLERVGIVPQVFLIRWVRLLFGREFAFDDLLMIWDIIFAEDPTLEIVDHICLVMLLRMRWQLVEADYNSALTLLLKYPVEDDDKDFQPQSLALDALYLREHLDYHGGSYLVSKYSGRPLLHNERPATPPALQRNITTFAVPNAAKASTSPTRVSPSRSPGLPARGIESVLRSTAKNIYARGEELGIGKAVKGAVDEVQRRAQEIRDLQTPSPPTSVRYRTPRGSIGSASLNARVRVLEDRSRQLAKLLEGTVAELWEYQKHAAEDGDTSEGQQSHIEKLSIAIAKVQFVHVYLGDPGLPLPQEEGQAESDPQTTEYIISQHGTNEPSSTASQEKGDTLFDADTLIEKDDPMEKSMKREAAPRSPTEGLADPSTFEDLSEAPATSNAGVPEVIVQGDGPDSSPAAEPPLSRPETTGARPSLEQSPFSWMLGQQEDPTSRPFSNASPLPPEHTRNRGSLFGGAEEGGKPERRERQGHGKEARKVLLDDQTDQGGFDMSSLRHGKKK